jgi:hypothetical protein
MEEKKKCTEDFDWKTSQGKKLHERHRHRWEDDIKIDV